MIGPVLAGGDCIDDVDVLRSECKVAGGQSGEPVTLIWLAGFRQFLQLARVVFVRPAVSSRGRALARRLGVAVLDEPTLAEREKSMTWMPERFAHVDGVWDNPRVPVWSVRTSADRSCLRSCTLRFLPFLVRRVEQFSGFLKLIVSVDCPVGG